MSWQIPQQIELDIIANKAQYRTFQTGSGGQSILPVPSNSYAVVFGYDFSPAGGGIRAEGLNPDVVQNLITPFGTQQISFYTGTDFFPFVHHVEVSTMLLYAPLTGTSVYQGNVFPETIARQVYITSSNDITITHGLIQTDPVTTSSLMPITNRTPSLLTYGGSGQATASQTDFGPVATPLQFMQPSPKDYQAFGFGLLPNGANDQAFATPDNTRGLIPADLFITLNFPGVEANRAANKYFLNLHYALYSKTIPEQRG